MGGLLTGMTSKVISLVHAKGHTVIIRNDGTGTISSGGIKIVVNGKQVDIVNPQDIEPQDTATLKFVPPELEMRSAKVSIFGASNFLSYTTDIIPHVSKVTTDTVALWHFDSVNATNHTLDNSQYHNDGYFNTSGIDVNSNVVSGIFGSALEFDGINDYVRCGNHSSLNFTGEITVGLWPKPKILKNWARFVAAPTTFIMPYTLSVGGTGGTSSNVQFGYTLNGVNYRSKTVSRLLTSGEWYHVVGVGYGDGTIKIYVDGSEQSLAYVDPINHGPGKGLLIGNRQDFQTQPDMSYNGTIDEVQIWNRALTQEEIIDSIYG